MGLLAIGWLIVDIRPAPMKAQTIGIDKGRIP
jgi:hypothetical protein